MLEQYRISKDNFSYILLVLLYFYIIEIFLKIIGFGVIEFNKDLWNIFDFIILLLYIIFFFFPFYFPVDIAPIRLIKLLLFLGIFIKPLKVKFVIFKYHLKR